MSDAIKGAQPTVVTGTVGVDAHVICTKIISKVLRETGFKVVALGAQTSPEEFIKAAQETAADAMLMTSLYGMAEMDLQGFRSKCVEAGIGDILLYIRHPRRRQARLRGRRGEVQEARLRPHLSTGIGCGAVRRPPVRRPESARQDLTA